MFSKKIMDARGQEKLLADSQAEHMCVQQFFLISKVHYFLRAHGTPIFCLV